MTKPGLQNALVIDQGSGSTRAMVYNELGECLASARAPIAVVRRGLEVEHDPNEVVDSVHQTVAKVLKTFDAPIVAMGMATQRSSVVCWDRVSGEALSPVLSWQDVRADGMLHAALANADISDATLANITGLPRSAHYGASKLAWCLQYLPAVQTAKQQGRLMMGPLASFLLHHGLQSQPNVADMVNAGRTLLFDINACAWSEPLLQAFGLSVDCLPALRQNKANYGQWKTTGLPFVLCTGDQNAAFVAGGLPKTDRLYVNIGTGGFVMQCLTEAKPPVAGMLKSIGHIEPDMRYDLHAGTVNGAASAVRMMSQQAKLDESAWLDQAEQALDQQLDLPLFINTVSGLGSPFWRTDIAPHFVDDAPSYTMAQRAAAVMESIAILLAINIAKLATADAPQPTCLQVSGGLSKRPAFMRRLADITQLPVVLSDWPEATARGTAFLTLNQPTTWQASAASQRFEPQQRASVLVRKEAAERIFHSLS